jgi:hypothetical protein
MNRAVSDNPLGLGLIIVGAIAMAISAFLPLVEPIDSFRRVEDNTLIQHGGWILIGLALGIAASGYRVSQGRWTSRWMPIVLCAVAAVLVVVNANDKGLRTLYPVGPDGNPITTQPGMVANLGIAIYVAGAGIAAALIGSVMLLRSAKHVLDDSDDELVDWWASQSRQATTKECPDCAETVLADARVCKHCGYRFAPAASSEPDTKPPAATHPQPDVQRARGWKGFVQDWNSVPAWQKQPKPRGKAQND